MPEPPVALKVLVPPIMIPVLLADNKRDDCGTKLTSTVTGFDVAGAKVTSPAFVAVTTQLPAAVPVRVLPLMVQGPLTA
ncbi:MAG: hypothetical protein EBY15_02365 [Gammaproteobacteria bacterium]|nr:hypothetical protein [Gammaproteobacteria bacterium]